MFTRLPARRLCALALPVLAVAALWLVPGALAKISINTVNTTGTVSDHGRHLVRFAFCKRPEVLAEAVERLATLA